MTAKQLITELQKFPDNWEVWIHCFEESDPGKAEIHDVNGIAQGEIAITIERDLVIAWPIR